MASCSLLLVLNLNIKQSKIDGPLTQEQIRIAGPILCEESTSSFLSRRNLQKTPVLVLPNKGDEERKEKRDLVKWIEESLPSSMKSKIT